MMNLIIKINEPFIYYLMNLQTLNNQCHVFNETVINLHVACHGLKDISILFYFFK